MARGILPRVGMPADAPSPTKPPLRTAPPRCRAAALSAAQAARFLRALAMAYPDAAHELLYTDPFTLLVAVVLSAQATDAGGQQGDPRRCSRSPPTPAAMVGARRGWRGRAYPLDRAVAGQGQECRRAVARAGRAVWRPGAARPGGAGGAAGVGRKTANVVLNVAFGESTMAVDTHIFRLGNRTGLAPGKTPREVEDGAGEALPPETAARRAPLADPARPLCLQGAAAGMLALPGSRALQLRRQGALPPPDLLGAAAPAGAGRSCNRRGHRRVGSP